MGSGPIPIIKCNNLAYLKHNVIDNLVFKVMINCLNVTSEIDRSESAYVFVGFQVHLGQ